MRVNFARGNRNSISDVSQFLSTREIVAALRTRAQEPHDPKSAPKPKNGGTVLEGAVWVLTILFLALGAWAGASVPAPDSRRSFLGSGE